MKQYLAVSILSIFSIAAFAQKANSLTAQEKKRGVEIIVRW